MTGKGGVGKSTVAAALGVAAARHGKRTIVCEVAQQERMSYVFHREGVGYRETEIGEDLYAFSIDPQRALEEYLLMQIRVKPVYDLMFKNRIFTYFAAATPGLRELVTVGKVWELAQLDRRVKKGSKYDLVIVDAPATGHGLGLLRTPKTFGDIARVGPIKRQADTIYEFITDPSLTSVVAVAWPEEMPVNETIDLQRNLKQELGLRLDLIFMNGIYPELFTRRRGGGPARARRAGLERQWRPARRRAPRRGARGGLGAPARERAHGAARAARQRDRDRTGRAAVPVPAAARHGRGRGARRPDRGAGVNVRDMLEDKKICICAGSGGVGKTTTSAAIAMGMAAQGLKVAVLTIDPAKRLANSLGLPELGNEERLVDPERFAAHGIEMRGELWAMMLDAKRTFDDLVERHAPTRRRATASCRTASTRRSPTRWRARRSTWRWRSSTSCTRRRATTCSCWTRRPRATRSTSSTRPSG